MAYHLGVDLDTTYTAAAVWRAGRVEIVALGNCAPVVPSVVLLRPEGDPTATTIPATTAPTTTAVETIGPFGRLDAVELDGGPDSLDVQVFLNTTELCTVVATVDHDVHDPDSGTCVALA